MVNPDSSPSIPYGFTSPASGDPSMNKESGVSPKDCQVWLNIKQKEITGLGDVDVVGVCLLLVIIWLGGGIKDTLQ